MRLSHISRLIRSALLVLTFVPFSTTAQEPMKLSVALVINDQEASWINVSLNFEEPVAGGISYTRAPGNVLVSRERLTSQKLTWRLRVDSDGDGNLKNEPPHDLAPNTSVNVSVNRKLANGTQRKLPYKLGYVLTPRPNNQMRERITWTAHYRAEGKLKLKKCEALVVAIDMDGNGSFDREDFDKGTSIGLDRNGDRKVSGKEEWLTGNQIVEYCDTAFLIEAIDVDGVGLSLAETSFRVPKIGETLRGFSLTTLEGRTIDLGQLRGKVHLLDFWASWCQPCVEKFAYLKKLDDEFGELLSIIAINVDERSMLARARQVINDYQLKWPQVMSGRGEDDPLWKTFGGMENNRLAIPLYVLVDAKGLLRYAGNGGDDLATIRTKLDELLKEK